MIFKEISQKPIEYIALLIIFILFATAFYLFSFDPHSQRRVIYAASGSYFLWSLYHHYKRGDLHISIVIEYLLIAIFGIVLLSSTMLY
ncbi:MAG: hypothetical protein WC841_01020 [Candidatus Shapirobacteria bacterium]|jgi:uncharacterized membrane protein YfcA